LENGVKTSVTAAHIDGWPSNVFGACSITESCMRMEEWKVAASVVGTLDSASIVVEEAESDAIARLEG
jgi:hypothetical protein